MSDVVLLPGSYQAMVERTWKVRRLIREGAVDPLAALATLNTIAHAAPSDKLLNLAGETAAQITAMIAGSGGMR